MGSASGEGASGQLFESRHGQLFLQPERKLYRPQPAWIKLPRLSFESNFSDISRLMFTLSPGGDSGLSSKWEAIFVNVCLLCYSKMSLGIRQVFFDWKRSIEVLQVFLADSSLLMAWILTYFYSSFYLHFWLLTYVLTLDFSNSCFYCCLPTSFDLFSNIGL